MRKIITFQMLLTVFFAFTISGVSASTYKYENDFDKYTIGEFSSQNNEDFVISTDSSINYKIASDTNSNKYLSINTSEANSPMASIYKSDLALSETFIAKQRINVSDVSRRMIFRLFDDDGAIPTVRMQDGKIYANDIELQSVSVATKDIDLMIVVDHANSKYDLYVDGYLKADDYELSSKINGPISKIELCEASSYYGANTTKIDDVLIWTWEEYTKYSANNSNVLYVSPTGNDQNSGSSIQNPLATIEAAKEKIREMNEYGIQRNYTVYVCAGEYSGISFNENDSALGNNTITYRPYNNDVVKITNAVKTSNWNSYNNSTNIYTTNIGSGKDIKTLYVGDSRAIVARYPNTGYNTVIATSTPSYTDFIYNDGDIPRIKSLNGLEAIVWPGGPDGYWAWTSNIVGVSKIDYTNKMVYFDRGCSYVLGTGSRYYLQNSLTLLDAENEFYYDSSTGDLYYCTNSDISSLDIRYDLSGNIMSFNNVKGINIKGFNISKTMRGYDAIIVENSEKLAFSNCKITQTGRHGIYLTNCNNIKVSNCEINDIGQTAVYLFGANNCTIEENHVYDTGNLYEDGTAIQLRDSGSNLVTKNKIHDTPRYGVSLKGTPYSLMAGTVINGQTVTLDNYEDFVATKNNVVSYNDIYDVNKNSQDAGLIELFGVVQNTISNNVLHDSSYPFSVGYGIYLDDSASHNLVEKNLMYNLSTDDSEGILEYVIFTKGIGNVITNNVLANNNAIAAIGSSEHTPSNPHRDLEITKNIIYNSGDNLYYFTNWSSDRMKVCDYNLFYNDSGKYTLAGKGAQASDLNSWKTVMSNKFDQHSIIANPLFHNMSENDYRLSSSSPAFDLGFVEFPACAIVRLNYLLNEYLADIDGNRLILRADVTKRDDPNDAKKSKLSFVIENANKETVFRSSVSKIIENNVPFCFRTVTNIDGLSDNCLLKIVADDYTLFTTEISELQ